MTIAIGLISSANRTPTIFLASDSQTTYAGGPKSLDAQKIRVIDFQNGQALVAIAGSVDLADKVVDIMQHESRAHDIEDDQTVARIASDAMRQIRSHFRQINEGMITTEDGWRRFFKEEVALELIVGHFLNGVPNLFAIDVDWALPVPVTCGYKSIGIGKYMGDYFLRDYRESDPKFEFAWPIAVSVIEKVVPAVDGCGGPAWVGMVYPLPKELRDQYHKHDKVTNYKQSIAKLFIRKEIDELAAALKNEDLKLAVTRKKRTGSVLYRLANKHAVAVTKS